MLSYEKGKGLSLNWLVISVAIYHSSGTHDSTWSEPFLQWVSVTYKLFYEHIISH